MKINKKLEPQSTNFLSINFVQISQQNTRRMHYPKLKVLLPKFFTLEEIQKIAQIKKTNAQVLVSRYIRKGFMLRITKNLYTWKEQLTDLKFNDEYFRYSFFDNCFLASKIEKNSYVSFYSALAYHGLQRYSYDYLASVTPKRGMKKRVGKRGWQFFHFPKKYFFGFKAHFNGVLIAEPEKALVDILYMQSFGKHFDYLNIRSTEGFSIDKLLEFSQHFPKRTQKLVKFFIRTGNKTTRAEMSKILSKIEFDPDDLEG